jgi:hypothetical protein
MVEISSSREDIPSKRTNVDFRKEEVEVLRAKLYMRLLSVIMMLRSSDKMSEQKERILTP